MTAIFLPDRPNLIWLEDLESTAVVELGEAKRVGAVHVRANPVEIVALLEEVLGATPEPEEIAKFRMAFIIDVMIAGLLDLSQLGVRQSETNGGLNGGYVFTDRVLRDANSHYRFLPVAFLSERELDKDLVEDLDYLRDRRDDDGSPHGAIHYFQKGSKGLAQFKTFLNTL
jgi:hypothetical protein